ncbi:hypothetical protein FH608_004915 [Nonomuraea phyllanthi]|uniref:Glycoside hydrolase 35 catalytic domain-containing protein n=1 Tax=Nonomuraea phyllanthi TaxID=2219224 RepID=A0A5C4WW80_9ACTN|nr:beta-galactosidase [Nonomuraea phyllanthi]KAB8197858.1 hypothetical protein FH608_004915 [Nonomuraea phyllanthi]
MSPSWRPPLNVRIADGALFIDDEPRLLLCASLFYFRIARGSWRERLRAVRESGYTCVDVYFPWNHHELEPGVWDFSGERDVRTFLEMAAEEGLWVVARPGPYICSEWDGGALPAWLAAEGVPLRQNDARFLSHVRAWFDRILPILRESPAVALVQLENELDFFDCEHPSGYVAALRDMALEHGIGVPLVACAGQGDLARAGGEVAGVVPAANFYPDDASTAIEATAAVYQRHLAERGLPLLVTETNRTHVTLRRLLSAGAKLIGPYLQASGNDFGFTTATNNWGSPLALLTSDYDFGGYLSPSGVRREEYGEARLLAGMIDALGPSLALAVPAEVSVTADFPLPDGGARALALHGGGTLVALANPGGAPGTARIGDVEVAVPARSCPFVLMDWGGIELATAELRLAAAGTLVFSCDGPSQVIVTAPPASEEALGSVEAQASGEVLSGDVEAERDGDRVIFRPSGKAVGSATAGDLRLIFLPRTDAARLRGLDEHGAPLFDDPAEVVEERHLAVSGTAPFTPPPAREIGDVPTRPEHLGAYRGFAWYAADLSPGRALLLHGASDVLSARVDGDHLGTVTPGGGFALLPGHRGGRLEVRTEIWGHPNFDDARLPALRLGSLRGFDAATAITAVHVPHPWRVSGPGIGAAPAPVTSWGAWITARRPAEARYAAEQATSAEADTWVLEFAGLGALVEVSVNGTGFGPVNPLVPYVDVTSAITPGAPARIELALRRWHGEPAGEVRLLEGRRATGWSVALAGEPELRALSAAPARPATLPVRLRAGELRWVRLDLADLPARTWSATFTGHDLKLTALFNGRVVGRLWLPGDIRPELAGGSPDRLTLPGPWFADGGNELVLLAEAVHPDDDGELTAVTLRA